MKLTYAQKTDLKHLSDPEHHIRSRSCTNSTLRALERRGLAKLTWERDGGIFFERWIITDAGRDQLLPQS